MKKTLSLFLVITTVSLSFGQKLPQTLKSETIDYGFCASSNGKATYQYYEDPTTAQLIKHGTFTFSENRKGDYGNYTVTISGKFKNGLRDGLWSYSIKETDFPNYNGTYTTGTFSSVQNFKDGLPNGAWTLNNSWKARDRRYSNGIYIWGNYEPVYIESASTLFKDGVATGLTSYNVNGKKHVITLTDNGFMTGTLSEELGGTKTEIAFNANGVMTKYVERVSSSGTVLNKLDFDPESLEIGSKYLSGQISKSELDDLYLKVDTVKGILDDMSILFEHDYFYLPGIDGDKSIFPQGSSRVYGRYIKVQRIIIVPFQSHSQWPRQTYSIDNKINSYSKFLEYYGSEISKEDRITIAKMIDDAKNEVENKKVAEKEYASSYSQIKGSTKTPLKVSKTENQQPFSESTHVFSRETKTRVNASAQHAEKILNICKLKDADFKETGYINNPNDYITSLKLAKEYISHLSSINLGIDSLYTIYAWSKDISFNINDIECKYIENQSISAFNVYNSSNPKETRKPKLYNAYLIILDYILNQTSNNTSFKDSYDNFQKLNEICWYMTNGLNSNTGNIEKQVKNESDPNKLIAIFTTTPQK